MARSIGTSTNIYGKKNIHYAAATAYYPEGRMFFQPLLFSYSAAPN